MEVDENQTPGASCKFSRVVINGGNDSSSKIISQDDKEGGNQLIRSGANGGVGFGASTNRLRGWNHHSSRIIRVSRASGGKDRHSKVWTSKGLRDRRVRLSVTTAIQFYDLQDRLGYDQPSKAVEWLIKAASDAISELPSLNTSPFPDTPKQLSDEKRASYEQGFEENQNQSQSQHLSLSKSGCSTSTSETSKNSSGGLSLSRSEIGRVNRTKARERARERAAKVEKEKMVEENDHQNMNNPNISHQNSSFTELLTGTAGNSASSAHPIQKYPNEEEEPDFFHKARQSWPPPPPPTAAVTHMDYFTTTGLLGHSSSSSSSLPPFNHHQETSPLQHFSFVPTPDHHLIPVAAATTATQQAPGTGGGDNYNLNFTISSGTLAGFNRGTLQSNSSPSFWPHHHLQRFSSIDGSSTSPSPFYIGTPTMENNHHHPFPAGLQLCYGDGSTRNSSDHKGKGKN